MALLILPAWSVGGEKEEGRRRIRRLGAGKIEGGSRFEEDPQEVVKMRMNEEHLQSVKKIRRRRVTGDNRPKDITLVERGHSSGKQIRMLAGSSANKDSVKKKRERIKRMRRKNMMELPNIQEILQKHELKSKSNTHKYLNHPDPTKAIDVTSIENPIVITVKDYEIKSINQILESKEQKVGDVVLVNGKPAIIKKRNIYPELLQKKKLKTHTDTKKSVDWSQEKLNRGMFGRKLLNKRK